MVHNIKDSKNSHDRAQLAKIFLLMIFALCSETFAQKFVCNKQNDKWEQYPLSPIEKKALKIVKKS